MAEVISKSDEFYEGKQWDQLYDYLKESLQSSENQQGEVYWRMARVCREMGELCAISVVHLNIKMGNFFGDNFRSHM